jgi:4-hydroxy-2-oxoheptanedioate aldolase
MLRFDKPRHGIFVKLDALEVVELVRAAGYDFAVIDLEHSQLSEEAGRRLVRHAQALGLPALVRIPELDRGAVNRLLEAGAAGIQLSTVRRAAEVRQLRALTRYPPAGTRSISLAHPSALYGKMALDEYLAAQDAAPPLVVAQIETASTEDPLDEILGSGPDVVFVGTLDLRVDLGSDGAQVQARVGEICAATVAAGVVLGGFGMNDPRVRYLISSSDLALLGAALSDGT